MKKFLLSFLALAIAVFSFTPAYATDYTVQPTEPIKARSLPFYMQDAATITSYITQQIYWPSLLKDESDNLASSGNITAISFYYAAGNNDADAFTRDIKIYLMNSSINSFTLKSYTQGSSTIWGAKYLSEEDTPGKLVYDGKLRTKAKTTTDEPDSVKLILENPFLWDGKSNIIMTVFDVTKTAIGQNAYNNLKFYITAVAPTKACFANKYWTNGGNDVTTWEGSFDNRLSDGYSSDKNDSTKQANKRSYVAKATFTIVPSIPQPTLLDATSISSSSATINWTAAAGADSYEVCYGTTSGNLGAATNVGNVTSYTLTGLEDETTYYYQVRTKIGSEYSAWTDESSFTTFAASPFVYKGITFSKWNTATSMPTSGNYYLNTDVELNADASLTGDLNLCLNGHNLLTYTYKITVSGHTFALYDNEGTGVIRGAHQTAYSGLIYVEADGVFAIGEGSVQNIAEENSVAIYNLGSLKLSGAPTISGVTAGIQLASSKYITIESGKPLTNTTPYSVNSTAQTITSGWSNMGSAKPSDYFTSAKSGYAGVCLNGSGEAQLVRVMSLDQEEDNASAISSSTYAGQLINVSLTRSLTSEQYNTFCLPFALDDDQLQSVFGADYDLQELTASSLTGETLNLEFAKCTALEAGKPYLLQPSVNVTNPVVFEGVTITAISPGTSTTDYVDYQAVYSPTELEGENKNLLFLGAGNELFWPESTGNLNGFRAYFEVKGAAQKAAKRARISMGGKIATGNLSPVLPQGEGVKILRDGKLYLMYKGQMYDVQGKRM